MADIKTRDISKGTIKTTDKAALISAHMKRAFISAKERAENSGVGAENSADEYALDRYERSVDAAAYEGMCKIDKAGRKGLKTAKDNIRKSKNGIDRFKERQAKNIGNKGVNKAKKSAEKTVALSGKNTVKTLGKGKAAVRSVKTSEQTARTAEIGIKAAVKATVKTVRVGISAANALVAAVAAGGCIAATVIIVICLAALIAGSAFGIFFSDGDSGTGQTMQTAVREINAEYDTKLYEIKNGTAHDVLEMSGSRTAWKDVLAVYAVKVNADPDNPQEVATMDDTKKQILSDIFWEMNEISSRTESRTETVITETDDGYGNIVQTESTITRTYLCITVSHKTVDEMATQYGFNEEQKEYLAELLKDENNSLWSAVLCGINYSDD